VDEGSVTIDAMQQRRYWGDCDRFPGFGDQKGTGKTRLPLQL
jgi:hypothetical protein